jgi:hypothetical protein
MRFMKLGSFALVAALSAGSVGCVVRAHGRVSAPVAYVEVDEEPPPPRVYVRDTRPGFVFIQGRWDRRGNPVTGSASAPVRAGKTAAGSAAAVATSGSRAGGAPGPASRSATTIATTTTFATIAATTPHRRPITAR